MKGLTAAAGIAALAMAILAFAGMGGFGFRRAEGPPLVVDRGFSAPPEVSVTTGDGRVVYDEFGPDPTVPVASTNRSQPLQPPSVSVSKPQPEVRVSARPTRNAPVVAKLKPRPIQPTVAKAEPRRTPAKVRRSPDQGNRQPRRVASSEPERLPPSRVYTPSPSSMGSSGSRSSRISDRDEKVDWDQIERDRAWRKQMIKQWEREERERKKKQERERRAADNDSGDDKRVGREDPDMEPVETVYKYERDKRRKRKG